MRAGWSSQTCSLGERNHHNGSKRYGSILGGGGVQKQKGCVRILRIRMHGGLDSGQPAGNSEVQGQGVLGCSNRCVGSDSTAPDPALWMAAPSFFQGARCTAATRTLAIMASHATNCKDSGLPASTVTFEYDVSAMNANMKDLIHRPQSLPIRFCHIFEAYDTMAVLRIWDRNIGSC